jgi:hypothetical protein
MHPRRRATAIVAAMVAATAVGVSGAVALPAKTADPQPGASAAPRAVPAAGTFYPTDAGRLLGSSDSGYAVEPGPGVTVPAAGVGSVPSTGVSAVVVNVLAVAGAADAGLSLGPVGSPTAAPLLLAPAGTTRSALLTIPVAAAGSIQLSASAPATVTVDLVGFYAADDTVVASQGMSGGYQPVDVTRILDTDATGQPLAAGARQVLEVDLGTAATPHTTAVLVRATATGATAAGTLTMGPADGPAVPSVPFAAGVTAANLALVPARVAASGRLDLALTNASSGSTGVRLDLVGFYDDGALGPNLRFRALSQTRVLDTATGVGAPALPPGARTTVAPDDAVVGDSTFALVGVATAVSTAPSDLDVGAGDVRATTRSVDLAAGTTTVPVQVEVGADRTLGLRAGSGGALTSVALDVTGSFEAYPSVANPAARGWVAPVSGWQVSASPR